MTSLPQSDGSQNRHLRSVPSGPEKREGDKTPVIKIDSRTVRPGPISGPTRLKVVEKPHRSTKERLLVAGTAGASLLLAALLAVQSFRSDPSPEPVTTDSEPITGVTYTVQAGDTISGIADNFTVTPEDQQWLQEWLESQNGGSEAIAPGNTFQITPSDNQGQTPESK